MLHKTLSILNPRERWQAAVIGVLTLVGAIAETLGLGAIFPFLQLINNPAAVADDTRMRMLFEFSGAASVDRFVLICALVLLIIFVCKNLFLGALYFLQAGFVFRVESRISTDLLATYLRAPYVARLERNSSDRIRIITSEVARATSGFMMPLMGLVTEGLVVLGITIVLLLVQPIVALIALVAIGVLGYLLQGLFKRRIEFHRDERVTSITQMYKWANQGLGAFKETKVLGREDFFIGEFRANAEDYARANQAFASVNLMPRLVVETVAVAALLGAVAFGIARGEPMHEIVPILALFGLAAVRIMPSATRMLGAINNLRFYAPAVDVVASDLGLVGTIGTCDNHQSREAPDSAREHLTLLELKNVSFQYPGSEALILDKLYFQVKHGEMIAIVGETGSGKTTLADLLLGLLDPTQGEIFINSRRVSSLRREWRGIASLVPQHFYLLDDTVRRNVAFGLADDEIDDNRVWQALQMARLDGKVSSMLGTLDASVGEQGALLSGGERQRLSIARALYNEPDILVFDEATSALDAATEAEIIETLRALAGRKTLILVTHRPATIEACDRVVVMRAGNIAAQGAGPGLADTTGP